MELPARAEDQNAPDCRTMPHSDADSGAEKELPPSQALALAALMAGSTVTEAAEAAGVDRSTVHRWRRQDATFAALYAERVNELANRPAVLLQCRAEEAVETLRRCMQSGIPSVEVRAASAILDQAARSREALAEQAKEAEDRRAAVAESEERGVDICKIEQVLSEMGGDVKTFRTAVLIAEYGRERLGLAGSVEPYAPKDDPATAEAEPDPEPEPADVEVLDETQPLEEPGPQPPRLQAFLVSGD